MPGTDARARPVLVRLRGRQRSLRELVEVAPPFLMLDDSYTDVQNLTALVKRIGLTNNVRAFGQLADAQAFLTAAADAARRPVLVFVAARVRGGNGVELLRWMRAQPG